MNNIFKNAFFGKAYMTRDHRKAIYQQSYGDRHILMLKDEDGLIDYWSNGNVIYEYSENVGRVQQCDDIISEWREEIDKEELEELTMIKYPCNCSLNETYCDCCIIPDLKEAFKVGYLKALENK